MNKMINYDSDESAKIKTITGWVSTDGYFYGDNEHLARWSGCTHVKCSQCDNMVSKHYTVCDDCRKINDIKRYYNKEEKTWDHTGYVYSTEIDQFFTYDELNDYIYEKSYTNKLYDPSLLRLVICDPVKLPTIDSDYFDEYLADDIELPDDIIQALDNLNNLILKSDPVTFEPGNYRTSI